MSKRKYAQPESSSESESSSSESESSSSESESSSSEEVKPTRVTSKGSKKSGSKLSASSKSSALSSKRSASTSLSKRSASTSLSKRSKAASDSDSDGDRDSDSDSEIESQGSSIPQPPPITSMKTRRTASLQAHHIPLPSIGTNIPGRTNEGRTLNHILSSLRILFVQNEIDMMLLPALEDAFRAAPNTKELSSLTVSIPYSCGHLFVVSGNSLLKHATANKALPVFQCNEGSCSKSNYKVNARKGLDDIISNYKITNTPDEIKAAQDLIIDTKLEDFGSVKVALKFPDGGTRQISLDTLRVGSFKYVPTTTVIKVVAIKGLGLLDARLKLNLSQAVKDSIVAQINQAKAEDVSKLKFSITPPSNYCCGRDLQISGYQLYVEEKNPTPLNCLCKTDLAIGLITSIDTIHDAILSQPTDALHHTEIEFTRNTCGHQSSFRLEALYREQVKDVIPECHICDPRLVVSKMISNLNHLCKQLSIPLDSDHVKKAVDTIKESVTPRDEVVKLLDLCGCELSISCSKLYQKPSHKAYKSITTKRCKCSIADTIKKNVTRFSKSDLIEFKPSQLVEIINCLNSLIDAKEPNSTDQIQSPLLLSFIYNFKNCTDKHIQVLTCTDFLSNDRFLKYFECTVCHPLISDPIDSDKFKIAKPTLVNQFGNILELICQQGHSMVANSMKSCNCCLPGNKVFENLVIEAINQIINELDPTGEFFQITANKYIKDTGSNEVYYVNFAIAFCIGKDGKTIVKLTDPQGKLVTLCIEADEHWHFLLSRALERDHLYDICISKLTNHHVLHISEVFGSYFDNSSVQRAIGDLIKYTIKSLLELYGKDNTPSFQLYCSDPIYTAYKSNPIILLDDFKIKRDGTVWLINQVESGLFFTGINGLNKISSSILNDQQQLILKSIKDYKEDIQIERNNFNTIRDFIESEIKKKVSSKSTFSITIRGEQIIASVFIHSNSFSFISFTSNKWIKNYIKTRLEELCIEFISITINPVYPTPHEKMYHVIKSMVSNFSNQITGCLHHDMVLIYNLSNSQLKPVKIKL